MFIEDDKTDTEKEESFLRETLGSYALVKACMDDFDFAIKLRTGEVIRFSCAEVINKQWIHLTTKDHEQPKENCIPFSAERGIDVRISDIVWAMDAPHGS